MGTPVRRRSESSVAVWIGLAVAAIVGLAVVLVVVFGNDTDDAPADDEWATFTDPATGLSVDLPGEPTTSEEQAETPDGSIDIAVHLVDDRDAAWSFTVYVLPSDELDLDRAIDAAVDGIEATLVDSSAVTVSGFPGVESEATFTENGRDGVVFTRIVLLEGDQTAVVLQTIGLETDRDMLETTFERLTGSFSP